MRTLLIVYDSMTGGARQMAEAAALAAAAEAGVTGRLRYADEAGPEDVLAADGYLFACPEMLGALSGRMKHFFDRTFYAALDRIQGRPYAALICAGSDGRGALRQIERIAAGWRLRAVAEPVIVCTRAQTPDAIAAPKRLAAEELRACADVGAAIAAGLALGIF